MKENKIKKPYFSHDYTPLEDKNLLKLFIAKGVEGYGLYWLIVEFMHQNTFAVGEENLLAFKFRTDTEKIKSVMNDFQLFHIEEHEDKKIYVSDRIQRNLDYAEEKNKDKKQAANVRWLLAAFNKAYIEFFDEKPVLMTEEVEALKKYNEKIPDLKDKLRDILFTLKNLKFDTDINFKPCANWLLTNNNLARLVNGEFGPLKHKKTEKEILEEKRKIDEQQLEDNKPTELEIQAEAITGKVEALKLIAGYYQKNGPLNIVNGRVVVLPIFRILMKKFDITSKEVKDKCDQLVK